MLYLVIILCLSFLVYTLERVLINDSPRELYKFAVFVQHIKTSLYITKFDIEKKSLRAMIFQRLVFVINISGIQL